MDLYIGVNGCSMKTEENVELVKKIPLDKIMIESKLVFKIIQLMRLIVRSETLVLPKNMLKQNSKLRIKKNGQKDMLLKVGMNLVEF